MAASDYWDSQDLKAVAAGGLVSEDVMSRIFDISDYPLPFTDLVGSDSHDNAYCEWTQDSLNAVDVTNAVVSGADAGSKTDSNGKRVGNHSQTSVKYVYVTTRAQNSNVIGRGVSGELAYGLMQRQKELKRDIEAMALENNASVEDDNNTTAGESGGFDNWIETNIDNSEAGAATGGFNTSTKIVDAHTNATTAVAGTEARLSALIETAYENNANPTVLMSTPACIKRLAVRLFSSSRVATPTANIRGDGGGVGQTSQGYITTMVTDFGFTLELHPNRLQQDYNSNTAASLFGIDPQMVALSYMHRPIAERLSKLGLSERWQISADWCVKVYEEKAHMVYRDIDEDAAWTA
ncbi:MAG: DUF5309 family protein [Thermoplasmata archaeon]|nr:MAG: DUF5309 family protein [Thermoplasmata archaeon]